MRPRPNRESEFPTDSLQPTAHSLVESDAVTSTDATNASWRDYYELGKPRVVLLIVFTAVVGMFLATPVFPPLAGLIWGTIGIGLAASAAAAINHVLDRRFDAKMARTRNRPLPTGHLTQRQALTYAFTLAVVSMAILVIWVNVLTAVLTFATLIGYAVIYTVWLKHATPQNIVIGGAAGAAPPVLGWVAVTGQLDPHSLLLFLIIFTWTPPHFWALAIARREEYAAAGIPMLPVIYGVEFTQLHILFYTILLVLVTLLPYLTGMSGAIYLVAAIVLGVMFLRRALQLRMQPQRISPMRTFKFSINYLAVLFGALLLDHYFIFTLRM
jgi:heme o synthase